MVRYAVLRLPRWQQVERAAAAPDWLHSQIRLPPQDRRQGRTEGELIGAWRSHNSDPANLMRSVPESNSVLPHHSPIACLYCSHESQWSTSSTNSSLAQPPPTDPPACSPFPRPPEPCI